ncbi:MAG: SMP-30/gluconolactonase/LRE family protein [Actinomycetota bacterium]
MLAASLCAALGMVFSNAPAIPSTVTLFAGGVGDGGPATEARLFLPTGVSVDDTTGNVYIADAGNSRIRSVNSSGEISTVAGSGLEGYSSDGVPAIASKLNRPYGVAVGPTGTFYIADTGNSRIRRVDASGTITTIAGTGAKGFSGDGGDATRAKLQTPFAVAAGPMNTIYVADTGNNRVRRVDGNGVIRTIAGSGAAGYSGDGGPATRARLYLPSSLAVDESGDVFVADLGNSRIRKIDTNGTITTVAGSGARGFSGDGGAARRARLFYPTGVALDSFGALFIADFGNNRVRFVDTLGNITTVAGSGKKGFTGDGNAPRSASMNGPWAVALSNNTAYVADAANNRVRSVTTSAITTFAGNNSDGFTGDGGRAISARLFLPGTIAAGPNGTLYIADSGDNRVRRVDARGIMMTIAGSPVRGFSGDGRAGTLASLAGPKGVAVDGRGNVFIADTYNNRIRKLNTRGIITTIAGTGSIGFSGDRGRATRARLYLPTAVAVDPSGNIFVADTANHRVRKIDRRGIITTVAGTGVSGYAGEGTPAVTAKLSIPTGLAVDQSGILYIADTGNHRIRKIDHGIITTVAGNGRKGYSGDEGDARLASLSSPKGVAVASDGTIYIADTYNQRIRKVTASRTISTLAGDGSRGIPSIAAPSCTQLKIPLVPTPEICSPMELPSTPYIPAPEEGLPSRLTALLLPTSVAVDSTGTLYICDTGDNRILSVEAPVLP